MFVPFWQSCGHALHEMSSADSLFRSIEENMARFFSVCQAEQLARLTTHGQPAVDPSCATSCGDYNCCATMRAECTCDKARHESQMHRRSSLGDKHLSCRTLCRVLSVLSIAM